MKTADVKNWLWVVAIVLCACDQNDRIAGGTSDETHTEAAARFLKPGGKVPASGALVQVVKTDGISAVATGRTDSSGSPVLAPIADGIYTVSVVQDGLVAFVDLVPASGGKLVFLGNDTLEPAGSLGGVVSMQPNHDPATVTVNVLGTDIWANVASDGKFRLEGLGAGTFRLRFMTTLPDYTIRYMNAKAKDGQATQLPDTVRMPYTGIPVVTGLSVRNDTLTGDQILSWNAAPYPFLQDYVIYRDTINSLSPSRVRYATVADTTWRDTGAARWLSVAKWKYRIAVETKSGDTGKWYGFVAGTSVPRVMSKLDLGVWSDVGRSWGGGLWEFDGRMTEIVMNRASGVVEVGIRRSSNGLLWDSVGILLPERRDGALLKWMVGAGAGRIWCLGHTLSGDGIDLRSSVDGAVWQKEELPDSLWPSLTDSLRWVGTGQRAVVVSAKGVAMEFTQGGWTRAYLPSGVLGATDYGLFAMGGGAHLLSLSWSDRSQILADEGIPPFGQPSFVVRWKTSLAAIAGGRLWIKDSQGWTLRRSSGLNQIATFDDRLIVSDSSGVLKAYQVLP